MDVDVRGARDRRPASGASDCASGCAAGERRQRGAGGLDAQQRRVAGDVDRPAARGVELRDQVDVGQRRRVADQERPRGLLRDRLERREAARVEVARPRVRVDAELASGAFSVGRFWNGWMPAFTISASWRARARSHGSARQQRRRRKALLEILEDRHRLRDRARAVVRRSAPAPAPAGSARVNSAPCCSPPSWTRFTTRRSNAMPFRCSAMRTRHAELDRQ